MAPEAGGETEMDTGSTSASNVKKRNEAKKSLLKTLDRKTCAGADKLFGFDKGSQDGFVLLRHLSEMKRRSQNSLRALRPHLLVEDGEFVGDGSVGTVKLSGYVRCGNPHAKMSVNHLVHVPGWGEFQVTLANAL